VVLFFLLACDSPLFQFFLVPIQLKFDLLDFLIDSEDSDLNVIESLFVLDDIFIHFLDLALEPSTLTLCYLPHMIFCLGFLILGIDQRFGVE
jgi:hypothetical protein